MKVDFVIDDEKISGDYNSQMPLSYLIREEFIHKNIHLYECDDRKCLRCLVYAEDEKTKADPSLILACMTPLFKLNGKRIMTYNGFMGTDEAKDLADAYKMLKIKPCKNCYNAKTMIFSFIVDRLIEIDEEFTGQKMRAETSEYIISSNLCMSSCKCLIDSDMHKVINTALKIRRNRIV